MVVYRHIRLDNNQTFYIGIGSENRAYNKHHRSNWWKKVVNKAGYRVEILAKNLTKELACELEMFLIELYGRKDLGEGELVNMTDGGEGTINKSDEVRKKISENLKGKPSGMKGKKMSDEHKNKIGAANKISLKGKEPWMKGKKHSNESKNKISLKSKGRKAWNKGVEMRNETKEKIRLSLSGRFGKKVEHIKTSLEYSSLSEACKQLNLIYNTELNRIKRNSKNCNFIVKGA
jgi:hypothetical protein